MDYASGDDLPGTIYEPLSPAFHTITPTHKGPIIIVTSVPLLIVATLTVAVRLWTVYSVTRTLGPSEATIIAAIVSAALSGAPGLYAWKARAHRGKFSGTCDRLHDMHQSVRACWSGHHR